MGFMKRCLDKINTQKLNVNYFVWRDFFTSIEVCSVDISGSIGVLTGNLYFFIKSLRILFAENPPIDGGNYLIYTIVSPYD